MSPESKRIALARKAGMSQEAIERRLDWEKAAFQMQCGEINTEEFYRRHLRVDPTPEPIPAYDFDLNAVATLEGMLTHEWDAYLWELFKITNPDQKHCDSKVIHIQNYLARNFVTATALQRCDALIAVWGLEGMAE